MTPIVAIAPLLVIWVDDIRLALLACAFIVAIFPALTALPHLLLRRWHESAMDRR